MCTEQREHSLCPALGGQPRWTRQRSRLWSGVKGLCRSHGHSGPLVLPGLQETHSLGESCLKGSTPGLSVLCLGLSTSHLKASVVALLGAVPLATFPLGLLSLITATFLRQILFPSLLMLLISNKPPQCPKAIWFVVTEKRSSRSCVSTLRSQYENMPQTLRMEHSLVFHIRS